MPKFLLGVACGSAITIGACLYSCIVWAPRHVFENWKQDWED